MNPLLYRISGKNTVTGKVETVRLKFGRLAYYEDEQTASRALAQIRSNGYYEDVQIQGGSVDWRIIDG